MALVSPDSSVSSADPGHGDSAGLSSSPSGGGWKNLTNNKKMAIIGGGAIFLGLAVYLYSRSKNSSSSATSATGTTLVVPTNQNPTSSGGGGQGYGAIQADLSSIAAQIAALNLQQGATGATGATAATGGTSTAATPNYPIIVATPPGVASGSPIPTSVQQTLTTSNSGYYGVAPGYSPSNTPQQNQVAEAAYANPNNAADQAALTSVFK